MERSLSHTLRRSLILWMPLVVLTFLILVGITPPKANAQHFERRDPGITVRVRGEQGEPIPGAWIYVIEPPNEDITESRDIASAITDPNGDAFIVLTGERQLAFGRMDTHVVDTSVEAIVYDILAFSPNGTRFGEAGHAISFASDDRYLTQHPGATPQEALDYLNDVEYANSYDFDLVLTLDVQGPGTSTYSSSILTAGHEDIQQLQANRWEKCMIWTLVDKGIPWGKGMLRIGAVNVPGDNTVAASFLMDGSTLIEVDVTGSILGNRRTEILNDTEKFAFTYPERADTSYTPVVEVDLAKQRRKYLCFDQFSLTHHIVTQDEIVPVRLTGNWDVIFPIDIETIPPLPTEYPSADELGAHGIPLTGFTTVTTESGIEIQNALGVSFEVSGGVVSGDFVRLVAKTTGSSKSVSIVFHCANGAQLPIEKCVWDSVDGFEGRVFWSNYILEHSSYKCEVRYTQWPRAWSLGQFLVDGEETPDDLKVELIENTFSYGVLHIRRNDGKTCNSQDCVCDGLPDCTGIRVSGMSSARFQTPTRYKDTSYYLAQFSLSTEIGFNLTAAGDADGPIRLGEPRMELYHPPSIIASPLQGALNGLGTVVFDTGVQYPVNHNSHNIYVEKLMIYRKHGLLTGATAIVEPNLSHTVVLEANFALENNMSRDLSIDNSNLQYTQNSDFQECANP